ncbi:MAG: hypothetical protein FGM14_11230 [Flavobacteriales bacterium]|nr:hypothetical protein [Flavobacteriales bacterium]
MTQIDFIYRSSPIYINGGWVQIDRNTYISPVGSTTKYKLICSMSIPPTPHKHFFKRAGEFFAYSLFYPPLPLETRKIDIIEKETPGTYFNFYGVDFSNWMSVPHPTKIKK